jgi:hypothetical protein
VQHIGPDYRPAEPPAEPALLIVHGDGEGEVGFLAVSAPIWRLLDYIEAGWTGRDALNGVAGDLGLGEPEDLLASAREALADLHRRGILLGSAPMGVVPPTQGDTA